MLAGRRCQERQEARNLREKPLTCFDDGSGAAPAATLAGVARVGALNANGKGP